MRRCISILLFAAFCLPLALPALMLGRNVESGLPACCRRNGAHHCAMSMGERDQLFMSTVAKGRFFHAPMECCAFCAMQAPSLHVETSLPTGIPVLSDAFFSHPSGRAQTESRRRIARDGSRRKRGPPRVLLA